MFANTFEPNKGDKNKIVKHIILVKMFFTKNIIETLVNNIPSEGSIIDNKL